ncbi:MAG: hypothetical protein U0441_09260 [Polyangiaceae bacterium]
MARISRPPGFDMTYRPDKRQMFGPPLRERALTLLYLAFASIVVGVIIYGQNAPSNSIFFKYVVELDRHRAVPASVCAIVLGVSATAAFLREQMRGVVVHPDGIELRELLSFGWPKVRRLSWSQIDRVSVPPVAPKKGDKEGKAPKSIRLDLWDGSRAWLPNVSNPTALGLLLERVALARAIPIEGGTGLLDDLGNPMEDDG